MEVPRKAFESEEAWEDYNLDSRNPYCQFFLTLAESHTFSSKTGEEIKTRKWNEEKKNKDNRKSYPSLGLDSSESSQATDTGWTREDIVNNRFTDTVKFIIVRRH